MLKKIFRCASLTGCFLLLLPSCDKKDNGDQINPGTLQLSRVRIGSVLLSPDQMITNVPADKNIFIEFSSAPDTGTLQGNIILLKNGSAPASFSYSFIDDLRTVVLVPSQQLDYFTEYSLNISGGIKGPNNESFPGVEYFFKTLRGSLKINQISLNDMDFSGTVPLKDIDRTSVQIEIDFSDSLSSPDVQSFFTMSGGALLNLSLENGNRKVLVNTLSGLDDYKRYFFNISSNLISASGHIFGGFSGSFYTALDSTFKFPALSDEELLELIQRQTFRYFWDFAHPVSGLARERNTSGNTVTSGGSGFGIMAIIVGMERGFITRSEGVQHMQKMVDFLGEAADRFHGVWPHWLNGNTGTTQPFSTKDNGADLVETAFLIQGLLTFRQYLDPDLPAENNLITDINRLWEEVEWTWFTRGGQNVLYWHWSPNYGWDMNMTIQGYNETLIAYVLAASSPTYPVDAPVYHNGYARNGAIKNGNSYYGITLPLGPAYGGPLCFTHYSHLGLDPRKLEDSYANYWEQNRNHTLINRAYCIDNPRNYVGYSSDSWGLTASDNHLGYSAHSPTNDLGVITPTAAVSALPYTPDESMDAIRHFYYRLGDRLWGGYGFYDAFNVTAGWWAGSYIAIDQGPVVVMIENYRTGLLWDLFMSCPEIQSGLTKLGFTY